MSGTAAAEPSTQATRAATSPDPAVGASSRLSWPGAFSLLLLLTGAIHSLAVAKLVLDNSHFHDDDIAHFLLLSELPLREFLLAPIDVHVVPFHRLATWLVYQLQPFDFHLAVGLLLLLHLAALAYLYGVLQRLRPTRLNQVIVFLCATNMYLFVPLMWWSSGIHRFPYILCALACVHHFLGFRSAAARRHGVAILLFLAVGVAAYTKALLIPLLLAGLELCLAEREQRRRTFRNLLGIALLGLACVAWFLLSRSLVEAQFAGLQADATLLLKFGRASLKQLSEGFLAPLRSLGLPLSGALQLGFWAALFLYTVLRRPSNLWVWLVGGALLLVHVEAVILAGRTARFGVLAALSYRLYFELAFLVAIFLGLALQRCTGEGDGSPRRSWLRGPAWLAALLPLIAYASLSYAQSERLLHHRYRPASTAKTFLDNLSRELEALPAAGSPRPVFAEGMLPAAVAGPYLRVPYSRFLPLLGVEAVFEAGAEGVYPVETYQIQADGRLRRQPAGGAPSPSPGS